MIRTIPISAGLSLSSRWAGVAEGDNLAGNLPGRVAHGRKPGRLKTRAAAHSNGKVSPAMTLTVLERIAKGDAAAVQECMTSYGGLVWSLALRMSPGRADAEDAVQEVFMDLWRNAAAYDPAKSPEKVFIAMIARRRLIDRWRSRSRRLETEPIEDSEAFLEQQSEAPQQTSVELDEAMAVIDTLDAEQRQVVLMGVVQGMTHSEIARETGKPLGTVKTQMRRGLIRIRARLAGGEDVGAEAHGVSP